MAWPAASKNNNCCWVWRRDTPLFQFFRTVAAVLYFFALPLFCAAMLIQLLTHDGEDRTRFGFNNPNAPFVQVVVHWLAKYSKVSMWFFFPATFAPMFAVPAGVGLRAKISLVGHETKHQHRTTKGLTGTVRPMSMVSRTFQVLMVLVIFTFMFTPVNFADAGVSPLASGFRVRPWAFIFLPVWVLIVRSDC